MHISVAKWCIVGYFSNSLQDLWDVEMWEVSADWFHLAPHQHTNLMYQHPDPPVYYYALNCHHQCNFVVCGNDFGGDKWHNICLWKWLGGISGKILACGNDFWGISGKIFACGNVLGGLVAKYLLVEMIWGGGGLVAKYLLVEMIFGGISSKTFACENDFGGISSKIFACGNDFGVISSKKFC